MRTILYASMMLLSFGAMIYSLGTRSHLEVNVLGDRNPLFITLKNGNVRNGFTFKILNKATQPREYTLRIEGIDGALMKAVGADENSESKELLLRAPADAVKAYRIYVNAPAGSLTGGSTDFRFYLHELDNVAEQENVIYNAKFNGPKG